MGMIWLYLLTGSTWKADEILGQAIFGGMEFEPDPGNGSAHLLMPAEAKEVTEVLDKYRPKP